MRYLRLFFFLLLGGCRSYQPHLPEVNVPTAWKEKFPGDHSFSEKNRFWLLFEDPILNELEEEAIAANLDLQIAASRIIQSRAIVLKEHGARLPEIDLKASLTEDETLLNPRSFGSPTKHLERVNQQQYNLLTGFSYELDLWGKLKDKEKSAHYRLKSSEWKYEFIYQTLVTDVALHYFALRNLEEEIAFLERTIDLWKENILLNECRVQSGLDSEIDLSRGKLELALVEAEIGKTRHQYTLQENALATLLAKPASSWKIIPGQFPRELPFLPKVIPSEILIRRADVQAALALISAGRYDVNVALKNYFPTFPLSLDLGLKSPFLPHFFEWQARYWGYALNAVQTLFNGGKRNADVQEAKARFLEYFLHYQKTVNQAFQDVEDSLSGLSQVVFQLEAQKRALNAARDTFSFAKEQFNAGLISYLLAADTEHTFIAVERQIIFLKGQQITAWIRLMKALGLQKEGSEKVPPA